MNLIVAVEKNWGIGKNGTMPWHISADLKYFKEKTLDKTVIMGRKTLLSFPNKKPLPKRDNIILSSNCEYTVDGANVINSISGIAPMQDSDNTFIIGGGSIYRALLPFCRYAYVTKINADFECDTFFENLDKLDNWKMVNSTDMQTENGIDFCFTVYENSAPQKLLEV